MNITMNFYIFLFLAILPVINIFWIVLNASRLKGYISEMPWLNEIDITSNGKIIFPQKLESIILKNADNKVREIRGLVRYYRELLYGFVLYYASIIILVVAVALKIIKIVRFLHQNSNVISITEITEDVACIVSGILILFGFYLPPLFENRKSKVLSFMGWTGTKLWSLVRYIIDNIAPALIYMCEIICSLLISLLLLEVYFRFIKNIFGNNEGNVSFQIYFGGLLIYQYAILKLFACIIYTFLDKVKKKIAILAKYCNYELIYEYLKNCTYLALIYINFYGTKIGKSDAPVIGAIGILFLVDDYINKKNNIEKKYRENSKNGKNKN